MSQHRLPSRRRFLTVPLWGRLFLALLSFVQATTTTTAESPFSIIVDGGSTGSRLHIFEHLPEQVIRRGSHRVNQPLSSFASSATAVDYNMTLAGHLLPAFDYAASVIPSHHHATTRVLIQATAGMRLVTPIQQDNLYNTLYQQLLELQESGRFVFNLQREDLATLSGDLEGLYGALAANYLKGTITADLEFISINDNDNDSTIDTNSKRPIGALDMGGSSTQIVFLPGSQQVCPNTNNETEQDTRSSNDCHAASEEELPSRLDGRDFFATSYLSYGVDQFRERLWNTWIRQQESYAHTEDGECVSKIISNPCTFRGYEIEWKGYTLVGTGNAKECVEHVQRLIPHPHDETHDDTQQWNLGKHIGGVEHPPVRGKFFAMSLYFFALDSLRELSAHEPLNMAWPTPSIRELSDALEGLCSRSWEGDLKDIQHDAHMYTRAEVLPHRCLEAVYMVTLLKDGFGFPEDSRDIEFTFLVDGSEVEWTLGMALALRNEQSPTVVESIVSDDEIPQDESMSCVWDQTELGAGTETPEDNSHNVTRQPSPLPTEWSWRHMAEQLAKAELHAAFSS